MHLAILGFIAAVVVAVSAVWAAADVRIVFDAGGKIGDYFSKYQRIRDSGEKVIIDGPCMSTCTLVVAIIPRKRLCATNNALLGFHAAWTIERAGYTTSQPASRALLNLYPLGIRAWISRRGGLTNELLIMRGRDLAEVVPACGRSDGLGALR